MTESPARISLDSPAACREELTEVSNRLAQLTADYQVKRARLGDLEAQLDELKARTLIGTEGANKEEREAKVLTSLLDNPETTPLVEDYAQVNTDVAILKQRIKTLEVRGTHAQSAIKSLETESRFVKGSINL